MNQIEEIGWKEIKDIDLNLTHLTLSIEDSTNQTHEIDVLLSLLFIENTV